MPGKAFHVQPAAISVNGVAIGRDDIAQEAQNHPGSSPFESWKSAARALVVRELLLQEARRLDLEPSPLFDGEGRRETDEDALVRQLLEAQVKVPKASDEACGTYYERHAGRFRSSDIFECSHILLLCHRNDAETRGQALAIAGELIAVLQNGRESFEALAERYSACPSAKDGGRLGQVSRGQTVPEFEAALHELEEGSVTEKPVESDFGVHVIRLNRRIEGAQLPLDLVREKIRHYLVQRARHGAYYSYVRWLSAHAKITGFNLETGEMDPAVVAPGPDANVAMRRFVVGANAEDWTRLVGIAQNAADPAKACKDEVEHWKPPVPQGERRTVFTHTARAPAKAPDLAR